MSESHYIIATAGHVDHGKSALVKALTGTDPDRLPEEKARGITIDLGFAQLSLPAAADGAQYHLGIVDVPGHEDFVKNMVAGVGSIDLALFVVAADDGWMPQSEEHLQILTYFGVREAVVALKKIDLREAEELAVVAAIRQQLKGTPFQEAQIVPTSVVTGTGIKELSEAMIRVLARTPPPRDIGKPRLPVDRTFTLHGIGTIVTGTLAGGTLRQGQGVLIQPAGKATRIRSLQTHNHEVESAGPGTRTALNLPDVSLGTTDSSAPGTPDIRRGDAITLSDSGVASHTVDVILEKSHRLVNSQTPAARPLKDGTRARLHHGSGNHPTRVVLLDPKPLLPGQRVVAQLRIESRIFALVGDRFILRDWSEQTTLAGGTVLDAEGNRRSFRTKAQRLFLARRAPSPGDIDILVATQIARDRAARKPNFLLKSHHSASEISDALSRSNAKAEILLMGDWVIDAAYWSAVKQTASQTIKADHLARPERLGLPLTDLRQAVADLLTARELWALLLTDLCKKDFVQTGTTLRSVTHQPALPPQLQSAGVKLRAALGAKPAEPPSRKELAPDALSQQALRFFIETGQATDLGEDVVLLTENFTKMKEAVIQFIRERGPATISDLRQTLATTRRIMVPFLERLDRDGVTARQGDKRILKKTALL